MDSGVKFTWLWAGKRQPKKPKCYHTYTLLTGAAATGNRSPNTYQYSYEAEINKRTLLQRTAQGQLPKQATVRFWHPPRLRSIQETTSTILVCKVGAMGQANKVMS
ncbi:UNVERIFIED_CONTAM: hypothetical protein K2H54_006805 [Gekko kuhli]